jgi:hypothetical protein
MDSHTQTPNGKGPSGDFGKDLTTYWKYLQMQEQKRVQEIANRLEPAKAETNSPISNTTEDPTEEKSL